MARNTPLIKGFNSNHQKIYEVFLDGEAHTLIELKSLFTREAKLLLKMQIKPSTDELDIDARAQSIVRNSMRLLVRDNWLVKLERGLYQLSDEGVRRVQDEVTATPSWKGRKQRVKYARGTKKKGKKRGRKKVKKKVAKKVAKKSTKKVAKKATKKVAKKSTKKKTVKKKVTKKKATKKKATKRKAIKSKSMAKQIIIQQKIADAKKRIADTEEENGE